jgi:hypothetical protein
VSVRHEQVGRQANGRCSRASRLLALGASLAVLVASPSAEAEPTVTPSEAVPSHTQINAGLRGGVAGVGTGGLWPETVFALGLHGDVLFGRRTGKSFALGPAAGVSTLGFRDVTGSAGASLLLPAHDYLPFVLSVGPTVRYHETFGTNAGGYASLFWGTKSLNYSGAWGLTGGIVVEGRTTFGGPRDHAVLVSAHVDLEVLMLPGVLILNAFRLRVEPGRTGSRPHRSWHWPRGARRCRHNKTNAAACVFLGRSGSRFGSLVDSSLGASGALVERNGEGSGGARLLRFRRSGLVSCRRTNEVDATTDCRFAASRRRGGSRWRRLGPESRIVPQSCHRRYFCSPDRRWWDRRPRSGR